MYYYLNTMNTGGLGALHLHIDWLTYHIWAHSGGAAHRVRIIVSHSTYVHVCNQVGMHIWYTK